MTDNGRFLGVDHDAIRSAAELAGPPRSAATSAALAYPFSREQLDAGKRGFTAGKATAISMLTVAAKVYRENGQSSSAGALESLIPMIAERELDIVELDPRR